MGMRVRLLAMMFVVWLGGCWRGAPSGEQRAVDRAETGDRLAAIRKGQVPQLLSEVGAFQNLKSLKPAAGMEAYEINAPFWADGAEKRRWIAVPPDGKIHFAENGEWGFPRGTIFVKHFELESQQHVRRRLETRVLVCDGGGGVSGASYKWRADETDADLVQEAMTERVDAAGGQRSWYFPGRADCIVCHTAVAGGVLGVKTRQINRAVAGGSENQLVRWNRLRFFAADGLGDHRPEELAKLAAVEDRSKGIEARARSFLDANCAHCHRPGGVAGNFDARFDTPLARQNLIEGPVLIDFGIDRARVIAPRDPWRSILLNRVETSDQTKMPPLAHEVIDRQGSAALREWIASLPGQAVLEPPTIEPRGGEYATRVRVVLGHATPGATIHYTLDGSLPGKSSATYSGPIELSEPATLRARAYKEGMTRSIAVQETFIVTP